MPAASPTASAAPTATSRETPAVRTSAPAVGVAASGPARVVVLDPGHNGGNAAAPAAINRQVPDGRGGTKACNTTGTSTDAGYAEHAFTFDVAQRVAQRLTARGVRVVLTRPDDDGVGPCVDERGRAGEDADADAVVSIHADGAAPSGKGFHVAYSDPPLNTAQGGPARTLAADLRNGLVNAGFPARPTSAATASPREPISPASTSRPARRRWWSARTCATRPRRRWSRPRRGVTATRPRSRRGSCGSSGRDQMIAVSAARSPWRRAGR